MPTEIGIETLPAEEALQVLRLELAESRREVSRLIDGLANIRQAGLTVAEMARLLGYPTLSRAGDELAGLCYDAINNQEDAMSTAAKTRQPDREATSTVSRSGSSSRAQGHCDSCEALRSAQAQITHLLNLSFRPDPFSSDILPRRMTP
jgi:hypothetical protein